MITFINSEQEYIAAKKEFSRVFQEGIDIVDNPFQHSFTIFTGFEFDKIYGAKFYDGLNDFLNKQNIDSFTFYTVLPDPSDYFFEHFSRYSIGEIPTGTSFDTYWKFLHTDPGNPADCLWSNAETIAMFTNQSSWGLIGSKDMEIGIIGFKDERTKTDLINCFDAHTFVDISERLRDLDEMLKLPIEVKAVYSKMVSNYLR